MADTLLVLLLGGRPQPNLLLALHLQPACVACVASRDSEPTLKTAERVLRAVLGSDRVLPSQMVPAYDVLAARAAIAAARNACPDLRPLIAVTGATVPMTVAGYDLARAWGSPAYYLNTAGAGVIDLTRPEMADPVRLALHWQDYLNICELSVNRRQDAPRFVTSEQQREQAAWELGQAGTEGAALIDWLRATGLETQSEQEGVWPQVSETQWTLLEAVAHGGLIDRLRRAGRRVSYRVAGPGERQFLNGHWLERYAQTAAESLEEAGHRFIDSCQAGLRVLSGSADREIDLIAVRRGVPLIASCKTQRDRWVKPDLDELMAVANTLGENYCARLYITNQPKPPTGGPNEVDRFVQFCQQAHRQRVVVVTGEDLAQLSSRLRKEYKDPTYPRR